MIIKTLIFFTISFDLITHPVRILKKKTKAKSLGGFIYSELAIINLFIYLFTNRRPPLRVGYHGIPSTIRRSVPPPSSKHTPYLTHPALTPVKLHGLRGPHGRHIRNQESHEIEHNTN